MRALNLREYREVCSLLERLDSGDAAARLELASRMASAMRNPGFLKQNPGRELILEEWGVWITGLSQEGAPVPAEMVAEAAIALLAMPSFQFSDNGEVTPSWSFVLLGEDDGRLYSALDSCDRRVSELFSSGQTEPYPVMGEGMIILAHDQVSTLHGIATRTKVSDYADVDAKYAEVVRTRLLTLLEWSLAAPDRAIAVSFLL